MESIMETSDLRRTLTGEALARFLFAGYAIFTLENPETKTRITYRLMRADPRDGQAEETCPIFVGVLTGSDNSSSFSYLGQIWTTGERPSFQVGRKSRISWDAPSAKGIAWLVERVASGRPLGKMLVWHEGRCGRCGRRLTVPESIETGLGPVCAAGGRGE